MKPISLLDTIFNYIFHFGPPKNIYKKSPSNYMQILICTLRPLRLAAPKTPPMCGPRTAEKTMRFIA